MSERVTMPALGESVTEGTVSRWLKAVGDQIEVDEPLLEVSTDKVDTEIPSPIAGTVQEILVEEDETVPVGTDLAVIGDGDASDERAAGSAEDQSSSNEPASGQEPDSQEEAEANVKGAPAGGGLAEEKPSTEQPAAQEKPGEDEPAENTSTKDEPAQKPAAQSSDAGSGGGNTITMPALGESVTEGTVSRWLKAEGDDVEMDEPLLEVSTDKVDTEIPSPVAGKLTQILVQEDETVPVGAELAIIGGTASGGGAEDAQAKKEEPTAQAPKAEPQQEESQPEEPKPEAPKAEAPKAEPKAEAPKTEAPKAEPKAEAPKTEAPKAEPRKEEPAPQAEQSASSADSAAGAAAYVTPLVRKLAAENQVDLSSLTGTGVGGRIRKQDVLDAAKASKQAAAEADKQSAPRQAQTTAPSTSVAAATSAKRGTTEKMSRMRKVIAARMVESLQTSAQLTTVVEVDVTKVARLRTKAKAGFEEREGVKLSFLPFFALATIDALKAHPILNASVEGDSILYHASENLGIAVDTDKGLYVAVIKEAGDLNIAGLSHKIADLAERTRTNKITPDELGGGTFTLTNTGSRGALFDTPIINQPQVGILGTGAVVKRPVVVSDADGGETIAIRSMVYLALSYDHRIVDGADAARFLVSMKERLEEGAFEV